MIPRIRFAHLPTPVEPMPRLSGALGGPKLWVKRDDQTGLAMGGNKTRKLEFCLAEAQAAGAKTLVTVGAVQSNHCRQTAALAARYGLGCIVVLTGEAPLVPNANLLLDELFGAEIIWTTRKNRSEALKKAFDEAWAAGRRPYLIPLGASNATGTLGYAFAFDEVMQQEVHPDWIVVASSSGGTQAGLVLGAYRARWQGKVLGISIDAPAAELCEKVAGLAREASDKFFLEKANIQAADVRVNADYLGAGYAVMGKPELEAIRLFAKTEGLLLDPVYTGRAAAGLIGLIQAGYFKSTETVLFWHTGGNTALFADPYPQQFAQKD
jgi:D-cysteine desulfhydrase family pyridoxal phosphate-dependent enzyme